MKKVIKFTIPLSTLAFSIAQALTPPDATIIAHYGTTPENKGEVSEVVTDANKEEYGLTGNIISGVIEKLGSIANNSQSARHYTREEIETNKRNNIKHSTLIGKLTTSSASAIDNSLLWGNHNLASIASIDKSLELAGHPYGITMNVSNTSLIGTTKLKQLDPNTRPNETYVTRGLSGAITNSQINGQDTLLSTSIYNHVSLLGNENEISACTGCDCHVKFSNINLIGDNNVISTLPKNHINNENTSNGTYRGVNLKNLSVMGKGNDIRYFGREGVVDSEYDINSIVLGNGNTIEAEANNDYDQDNWKKHFANSVVLGHNNKAYGKNNVVIGSNGESAIAEESKKVTIRGTDYNFAGATLNYENRSNSDGLENAYRTVSFGKSGYERQLKNVAAGVISSTSTDGVNGSQLHAVIEAVNNLQQSAGSSPVPTTTVGNGLELKTTNNTDGGKNYEITAKVADGLTFNEKGAIKANLGKGLELNDNKIVAKLGKGAEFGSDNEIKAKIGDGLEFGNNGEIKAKGTTITAGKNVSVTGDALNGYTISSSISDDQINDIVKKTKAEVGTIVDTNTQSVTKAGSGVSVTEADNDKGTKDYTVSVNTGKGVEIADNKVNAKIGDGLEFGDNGEIKAKGTTITAGENITVTGDAHNGYTINAKKTVIKGEGNTTVTEKEDGSYTITSTNTQSTSSAGKGLELKETNNANGTKHYEFGAKLGQGLHFDENGAIASDNASIIAGDGIKVENTAKGTKISLGQDFKNINAETLTTKEVHSDKIEAKSVQIGDIKIDKDGINMNNKVISNVADGVKMNDVSTVGQVVKVSEHLNRRLDGMEKTINKNRKVANSGIASVAAMANIPQVMSAGKSGVGIGVGHRDGQNALAVGYSRASDNAKHVVKMSASFDSQNKSTLGAGYMFMW